MLPKMNILLKYTNGTYDYLLDGSIPVEIEYTLIPAQPDVGLFKPSVEVNAMVYKNEHNQEYLVDFESILSDKLIRRIEDEILSSKY